MRRRIGVGVGGIHGGRERGRGREVRRGPDRAERRVVAKEGGRVRMECMRLEAERGPRVEEEYRERESKSFLLFQRGCRCLG